MADISVLNTTTQLSGKTLVTAEGDWTITGLHTFDRDPSAPFAVSAGSSRVSNLDADKVDGVDIGTLAQDRVLFAASPTAIASDEDLTFDGTTLKAPELESAGDARVGGDLEVDGALTVADGSVSIGGAAYEWPASNAPGFLLNDGAGNLTWQTSTPAKYHKCFTALSNQPPSSSYATFDTRNSHPVLDFDDTLIEAAIFGDVLPETYGGGGLAVDIYWTATSATSGDVEWRAAFEAMTHDIDSDSFASNGGATSTAPTTSGIMQKATIIFADGAAVDNLAGGDAYRLRIQRDATGVNDTMTGDAELHRVVVREL